jgi:hypothetical protein
MLEAPARAVASDGDALCFDPAGLEVSVTKAFAHRVEQESKLRPAELEDEPACWRGRKDSLTREKADEEKVPDHTHSCYLEPLLFDNIGAISTDASPRLFAP